MNARGREGIGRAALCASLLAVGCTSSSITSDLARVRTLTRAEFAPGLERETVREETSSAVREILRRPLGPTEAVRIAVLNHRPLRATLRELGVERGRVLQAGLLPNPVVEFDVRTVLGGGQPLQYDLRVEYDLTGALLAPRRSGAAGLGLEVARTRAAEAVVSLGYRARAAYFAAQAAEASLALAQRSIDALVASRDAARALHAAGNLPRLNLSSVEAAYEQGRVRVAQAELEVLDARERLNVLLGVSGDDTRWTLTPAATAVPSAVAVPDGIERLALERSLGLAAARQRLEAVARRTGLYRSAGWLPDITVDAHAEQDGPNLEIGGGARVALPFFNRQQGNVLAAEAEFDGLRERYVGMAVELRSRARRVVGRFRSAHLRARQWHEVIVPARRRVLEETLLQYNAMQVGVFQLLQARRDLLEAETAAVAAQRDFQTAAAGLDALLAGAAPGIDGEPTPSETNDLAGDSAGAHKGGR